MNNPQLTKVTASMETSDLQLKIKCVRVNQMRVFPSLSVYSTAATLPDDKYNMIHPWHINVD